MDIKKQKKHDSFTDILHLLLKAHTENPDERFCQLVSNIACMWGDWKDKDIFYCSDDQFTNGLENLLDEFKQLDNYEK